MIRLLPAVVEGVVLVFCLIDVILADEARVRNLRKWLWALIILLLPVVGGVVWLVAGRPLTERARPVAWPSRTAGYPEYERPAHLRPRAPDDDPEFLARLQQDNAEHERLLKKWEDDLRRREDESRGGDGASGAGFGDS